MDHINGVDYYIYNIYTNIYKYIQIYTNIYKYIYKIKY